MRLFAIPLVTRTMYKEYGGHSQGNVEINFLYVHFLYLFGIYIDRIFSRLTRFVTIYPLLLTELA